MGGTCYELLVEKPSGDIDVVNILFWSAKHISMFPLDCSPIFANRILVNFSLKQI